MNTIQMLAQALQLFEFELQDHDPFPGFAGADECCVHQFEYRALAALLCGFHAGTVLRAMQLLGRQFVLGETIEAAAPRADELRSSYPTCRFSYDMLGEGVGPSGTGPKTGGPHYLARFCAEQTVTINTAAAGGNAALLAAEP